MKRLLIALLLSGCVHNHLRWDTPLRLSGSHNGVDLLLRPVGADVELSLQALGSCSILAARIQFDGAQWRTLDPATRSLLVAPSMMEDTSSIHLEIVDSCEPLYRVHVELY